MPRETNGAETASAAPFGIGGNRILKLWGSRRLAIGTFSVPMPDLYRRSLGGVLSEL